MTETETVRCPSCGSQSFFKDGHDGGIQRYLCRNRDCGRKFRASDRSQRTNTLQANLPCILKGSGVIDATTQLCADTVKKLDTPQEKLSAGESSTLTQPSQNIEGTLVSFLWHMRKKGLSEATAKTRYKVLKLLNRECNIWEPESVKKAIVMHEYIDKQGKVHNWSDGHKSVVVTAYSCFCEMQGMTWDAPEYEPVETLPFVPLESEIDCLISASGKKMATCLQLLKETGMRIGEAWRLRWTDMDAENSTVRCTAEKHGYPRQFKMSSKLLAMLNSLPKKSEHIFGTESLNGFRWKYDLKKRRLAETQQNPRLLQIKLHTFRHFFATMLYHRTKNIVLVKEKLGHKRIDSTMVYTHLVNFESDDYHSAIAKTIAEERQLIETGFEFVRYDEREEVSLYRKLK